MQEKIKRAWRYLAKKNIPERIRMIDDGVHWVALVVEMIVNSDTLRSTVAENVSMDARVAKVTEEWEEKIHRRDYYADLGNLEEARGIMMTMAATALLAVERIDNTIYTGRDLYDLENKTVSDLPLGKAKDDPSGQGKG